MKNVLKIINHLPETLIFSQKNVDYIEKMNF